MIKIKRYLAVVGIITLALGGFVFGLSSVSAEEENEMMKKQNEQTYEMQKKASEQMRETQKQNAENVYEAQKKVSEQVREAEKKEMELQKEQRHATSSDDDGDEDGIEEDEDDDGDDGDEGDHHRSAVAEFVRKWHKIASSTEGGIGEHVREVAKEQNDSKDKTAETLKMMESRSAFMKFLIGANRDRIKELQDSETMMQNHIDKLNQIKSLTTGEVQNDLNVEIEALAKEKERVQTIIGENQSKSGIFGWLIRIFE